MEEKHTEEVRGSSVTQKKTLVTLRKDRTKVNEAQF
jgi:hypothetical protein